MNERILQLAKQAGLDDDMFPLDEWDNPELEKFAKLIIQECAKIATYPQLGDEESYYGNEFAKAIKKHFGVKE
jgi:hypothetical protein